MTNYKSRELKLTENLDFKKGAKLCYFNNQQTLFFGNDINNYIIDTSNGKTSKIADSLILEGVLDCFYSPLYKGILALTFSKGIYLY